jgi:uncharacterized protein (TIGR00255 family)
MTGFGRAQVRSGPWRVDCEARSVNHRFLDLRIFLPEGLGELEESIRRCAGEAAARGRLELRCNADRSDGAPPVRIDRGLAKAIARAGVSLGRLPGVEEGIRADRLLEFPGLLRIDASPRSGGPRVRLAVRRCAREALRRLDAARRAEGRHLARDVTRRLARLERLRRSAEEAARRQAESFQRRLRQRLEELCAGGPLDGRRLEQEAALLAARADITEELVKLRGLVEQARTLLGSGRGPVGKRLDFLVQEMNREANTIGSKAAEIEVTSLAVDMKTEVERIREQVQNLE